MNKKIFSVLLSIVLPLFIVSAVVYSASTIGNAISVGTTLTVTGTTTLNDGIVIGNAATDKVAVIGQLDTGLVFAATTTAVGIDMNGATFATDIRLDAGETISNSGNTVAISAVTTTFDGAVELGNAAADKISVFGTLDSALTWAATTTANLINLDAASSTGGNDIKLSDGTMIMVGDNPSHLTGSTSQGSLFISNSGYGLFINFGNYWYQVATTALAKQTE